nr:MAG TPA: Plastocyanin [Caudoviricetes sp.]
MIISREKMQKGQSRIWSPETLRFQRGEAVVW